MKTKNISIVAMLLLLVLTGSCKKDKAEPGTDTENPDPIPFTTLIVRQEVPDTIGIINITGDRLRDIRDAVMLEDGSLLAIIGFALYHYKDGVYSEVMTDSIYGVQAIGRTSDGKIYVLGGSDALYTSLDNGATFTKQEKFLASLGQDVALSLYYNGGPGHMLVRKLSDGSYLLWLYSKYTYNIGGTGFTQDRFMHFVFSSSDGMGWSLEYKFTGGSTYYPAAVDNNGMVYIVEEVTDGSNFQKSYRYYESNDYGNTQVPAGGKEGVNAVSADNQYYSVRRILSDQDASMPDMFSKWVNGNWQRLNPVLDDKFRANFFSNDFICERVHFTPDRKMLLISNQGILIADRSF